MATPLREHIGWRKHPVFWRDGRTLYVSVVFSWHLAEAKAQAKLHKGPVVAGGPAVVLNGCDWAETAKDTLFDVLAMHNPLATFTTRGCPRRCAFCAVPKLEGAFRELPTWKPAPIVCDNNLMHASRAHFERVIESLRPFAYVDFNQGLDARLFTAWHATQLARLNGVKVRFAFDHLKHESAVVDAIHTARAAGLRDFGVYVLIGFKDTPESARYRLEKVRSLGIWPNPMRYQPLDATQRDHYVAAGWTNHELHRMMRYYARLRWLDGVPYEEYRHPGEEGEEQQTDLPLLTDDV